MSSSEESSVVLTSATEQWRRSFGERFVKISYNRFMQEFVTAPPEGTTKPNYRSSFMGMPRRVERLEAGRLLECFHKCLQRHRLHPGYKFVAMRLEDTDEKEDGDEDGSVSTVGRTRRPTNGALFLDDEAPDDGGACWTKQAMTFKFVRDDEDPFEDEIFDEERLRYRRHLISCIENVFSYQHRAFCFMVLISGNHARLLRWDRCGALFTEKFHFRQDPDKLGEFLWRFSQMSPAQQGYDTTVARVEKDSLDYLLMKRLASEPLKAGNYIREYFEKSLDERLPWWKVRIDPDEDKVKTSMEGEDTEAQAGPSRSHAAGQYFLVGGPRFETSGLASRGMRGYVAVDCQTERFVFLKDTWRNVLPGIGKEGDILKMLNAQDVANVPTLICHGDVSGQATVTDEYWNTRHPDDDSTNPTTKQLHYRLVVAEVGRPLRDFRTGKELVMIIFDCIEAHRQAYEKCQVVHFDVSAGNILIVERSPTDTGGQMSVAFSGLLTDWEISKMTALDGPEEDRRRTHMGTWQFLSAMVLSEPDRGICLADELESFFNVLLYYSVKYLPHNIPDPRAFMSEYFDRRRLVNGKLTCGFEKRGTMRSGELMQGSTEILFGQPAWDEDYPLDTLLITWLSWLHARYYLFYHKHPRKRIILSASPESSEPDAECSSSSARRRITARQARNRRLFGDYPPPHLDEEQLAVDETIFEYEAILRKEYVEEAKNMDSHSPILALFRRCVDMDWPEDDKQPSQVLSEDQKTSHHRKRRLDVEDMPLSNKRTKLMGSGHGAVVVSARAQLPSVLSPHLTSNSRPSSPDNNAQGGAARPVRRVLTRRNRHQEAAGDAEHLVEEPAGANPLPVARRATRATPASRTPAAQAPRPTGTRTSSRLAAQRNKLAIVYERGSDGDAINEQLNTGKRTRNRGRR